MIYWFLFSVLFLILLCFILAQLRFTVKWDAAFPGASSSASFSLFIFRFRLHTWNIPSLKKRKKKKPSNIKDIVRAKPRLIYRECKKFTKKIVIKKLELKGHIGTGDAALTALSVSAAYSVAGILIGIIDSHTRLEHVSLNIRPVFEKKEFSFITSGIVKCKIAHIISAAVRLFFLMRRIQSKLNKSHKRKGWIQYVRTPN